MANDNHYLFAQIEDLVMFEGFTCIVEGCSLFSRLHGLLLANDIVAFETCWCWFPIVF